jgi:multiple sugar transport system permease protein
MTPPSSRRREESWQQALLLAPGAILIAVVVALPIARVLQLSASRVELAEGIVLRWAGLEPTLRLWQDGRWWAALRNTLVFALSSVAIEMVLGTAMALVLHRTFRGRGAVRALAVLPWALPTAVMALAWAWIFNDSFGVANDLLRRIGLAQEPIAWLAHPFTAMFALVVADAWKTTPFVALIVLAGLASIPQDLVDAARVDGLPPHRIFTRVILPLLAPSLVIAAAFRLVQAFGAFDLVYVMTGGGPGGSTETVSLYAYQNYFRYLDFGYGSTIAVQGALIVALLAYAITRLGPRAEDRT